MTETQFDVLKHIAAHPCISMSRLGEDLGRDALRLVMGMQSHRYIEKTPLGLVITPKGFEALLSNMKPSVTASEDENPVKAAPVSEPVSSPASIQTQASHAPKAKGQSKEGWVSYRVGVQRRWFKPLRVLGETLTEKGRVLHLSDRATGRTLMIEGDVRQTFDARDLPRGMDLNRIETPMSVEKITIDGKVYTILTLERDFSGRFFWVKASNGASDDQARSSAKAKKELPGASSGLRFLPL